MQHYPQADTTTGDLTVGEDLAVAGDAVIGDDADVVGDLTAGTVASDAGVTATTKVTGATLKVTALPVYADEAAAAVGLLATDEVYQTVTGELRIKL